MVSTRADVIVEPHITAHLSVILDDQFYYS